MIETSARLLLSDFWGDVVGQLVGGACKIKQYIVANGNINKKWMMRKHHVCVHVSD